ncbi:MAG: molecular chaperone HtpG [Pseudomonadales bacterium]|jgi:molecular chaperone HtpG|tara:strand:- start:11688 stop:13589 length:1902 start_codon:yes stop_codon:yes gene_type:complete
MSEAQSETLNFQTEAKQLLQLMIHSLYSNREIFLRELISNASDAIDKLRFLSIEDQSLLGDDSEFRIDISFDADAKTLTIFDNGIGMNRDEVIAHLGTIAKSGTAEFLSNLTGDQKSDSQLIGQFGVGFYSAFMVADKVEVCTLSAQGGDGVRWQSTGEDAYSLEVAEGLPRGTQVILHLKDDALDFAEDFRLRNIVIRYSDHIGVPVRMLSQSAPAEEGGEAVVAEFEAVNSAQALWTRSRSEVEDAEYQEFYKHISHDFEEPLAWSHNRVEGKFEYTSLVYVPKRAPFDLYNREVPKGLKLYVQRVFIMDDAEQFLPLYLRFVKGVIDSNDLPLNVSREILQQDDRVTSIRNAVTKRVLSMLEDMAKKDPEQYQLFWDEFGEVLKEGAGEDFANRASLSKLLRFASTHESVESGKKVVGLDQYLERKVEGQDTIYYICAEAYETASRSPHLEIFKERGVEVLVLFDRIDEWLMSSLTDYEDTKFVDVMRGDVILPGEETAKDDDESKDKDEDEHPLVERISAVVGDKVKGVRPSKRLTGSPACLVLSEDAMGIQMRRIMEASGQSMPESKPFFEFNAGHPLVERLENEVDEDRFAELVGVLFDQASLAEGGSLQDPAGYVERLNRLLLELL